MNKVLKAVLFTVTMFLSYFLSAQACKDLKVSVKITVIEKATCARGGTIEWELVGEDVGKIDQSAGRIFLLKGDPVYSGNRISNVEGGVYLPSNGYTHNFICPSGENKNMDIAFEMPFGLDIKDKSGQICTDGTLNLSVVALNGSDNYTYTLNLPSGSVSNTTGIFSILLQSGDILSSYKVNVKDNNCNKATAETVVEVANYALTNNIIEGNPNVCENSTLNLNVNFPSTGTIEWCKWETPSGEVNGNKLSIPSAKSTDAGKYTVQVKIKECADVYKEEILVDVLSVPQPQIMESKLCKGASMSLLDYVTSMGEGYELLWKVGNTTSTDVPQVSTEKEGEFEYFVQQRNISLGCVSGLASVKVNVLPLPTAVNVNDVRIFINPADPQPEINIPSSAGYSYKLYTASSEGSVVALHENAVGGLIKLNNLVKLSLNTTYYLAVVNENACEAPTRTPIEIGGVQKLIDGPRQVCLGSSFTLKSMISGDVKWTTPYMETLNEKNLVINSAELKHQGVYTVEITTELGLVRDTFEFKVIQIQKPQMKQALVEFCLGANPSALDVTAEEGNTLKWTLPSGGIQTSSPVPSTSKIGDFVYLVKQVSAQACESEASELIVRVHDLPKAVPSDLIQVCLGVNSSVKIKETQEGYIYELYKANETEAFVSGVGNGGALSLSVGAVDTDITYYLGVKNENACVSEEKTAVNILAVSSLIKGTSSICEGKTIQLQSPEIEGAVYNWTLPNSTTYTGNPLPAITNVGPQDAGKYKVSIQLEGCSLVEHTYIVAVGKPELVQGEDNFEFCKGSSPKSLSVTPSEGCDVIWYDSQSNKLGAAPIPNTDAVGTILYYVAQSYNDDPTCIGDKKEIRVDIVAPPVLEAINPITACKGSYPSIRIENSSLHSMYYLFDSPTSLIPVSSAEGNGETIDLKVLKEANQDTIYYVGMSNHLGCSSETRVPAKINISDIAIFPESIPPYQRDVMYELKLETTASSPYVFRRIEGELPIGFDMSMDGEIRGTAPATGSSEPKTFIIEVEDANLCKAQREYTLRTDLIIPEMFSPNGDGINDNFMTGFHVTIFNRLGVRIFEGNDGWDGTRNGVPVSADIYFFIVKYVADDGSTAKKTGSLMLLKKE